MHHKEEDIKCFKFPSFSDFLVWKGEEEATAIVIQYMKAIKEKISSLSPQWFMSDDTDQFFNVFRAVFGKGQTKKVLCAWHLDGSWRRALRQHVKQTQKGLKSITFCVSY